jgi:NADH:ubiquinone oxidoreductase subunit E
MRGHAPTAAQNALLASLRAALGDHTHLSPQEILAVTSQLVGMLVAVQDQTRFTPDQVMEVVAANIESGNREVVASLLDPQGSA